MKKIMVLLACAMLAFFTSCSQDGDSSSSNPDGFEPGWYEYIGESLDVDHAFTYNQEEGDKKAFFNFDKNCKIEYGFIDDWGIDKKDIDIVNKLINFSMLKNGATTFQKITLDQLLNECRGAVASYDPEIRPFMKTIWAVQDENYGLVGYPCDQKIYYPGKVSKILITNSEPDYWDDTEHDIENDLHELNKTLVIGTDEKGNYFQFKAHTDKPSYKEEAYVNLYVQQHDLPFYSYEAIIYRPSEE